MIQSKDITIIINVRGDIELLWLCIKRIRDVYNCRVAIISDGYHHQEYNSISSRYDCEYIKGDYLFALENGGKFMHRFFSIFMNNPTRWGFKFDADTYLHRPFNKFPKQKLCMFGKRDKSPSGVSIQGGACGFTFEAAEKFIKSEIFLDPALANNPLRTWAKHDHLERLCAAGAISTDWITAYCADKLRIFKVPYDEVFTRWPKSMKGSYLSSKLKDLSNEGLKYAVTHPCLEAISELNPEYDNCECLKLHLQARKVNQIYC